MKLLVVDDEENIVEYLTCNLEAEGFLVDTAVDGLDALDKALTGGYDAITLDVMLPGMNGYEVCRRMREAGVDTPVLMLTAKDGEYDEADAFDIGADDFLRKPFSLVVLVARLRSLLRRGSAGRGSVLEVGDVTLDAGARTVTCAGDTVELTNREFSMLEYLMHNAGQVVSKAQLLEHVWGTEFVGENNLVEVYIGYVRKKIDAPYGANHIQTVRGAGYKFVRVEPQ